MNDPLYNAHKNIQLLILPLHKVSEPALKAWKRQLQQEICFFIRVKAISWINTWQISIKILNIPGFQCQNCEDLLLINWTLK